MSEVRIKATPDGWPFWIHVDVSNGQAGLRLWEAKALRVQLDEAIEYVERKEELEHALELKQVR